MKKAILLCVSLLLVVGPTLTALGQTSPEASQNESAKPSESASPMESIQKAAPPGPPPPPMQPAAQKEPPGAGAILGDFIFLRPLSFAATIVGIAGTVATFPIALPSGSVGAVSKRLIAEPFKFTFTRPLGTFPEGAELWP